MTDDAGSGPDPAALWLCQLPGMTPKLLRRLLGTFGSAADTLRASSSALREHGVAPAQVAKLVAGPREVAHVAAGLKGLRRLGIVPLPYGAAGYPDRLLDLPDPPLVVYVQGAWPIAQPLVAVVWPEDLDPALAEPWAALLGETQPHIGFAAWSPAASSGVPLRLLVVPFGLMLARQRLPKPVMEQVGSGKTTLLTLAPPTAQPTSAAALAPSAGLATTLGMLVEAVVALPPFDAAAHLVAAARGHGAPTFAFGAPARTPIPAGFRRLRPGKAGAKTLRGALGLNIAGTTAVQQERLF